MEPLEEDVAATPSSRVSQIVSDAVDSFTSLARRVSAKTVASSSNNSYHADDYVYSQVGLHDIESSNRSASPPPFSMHELHEALPDAGSSSTENSSHSTSAVVDMHLSRDPSGPGRTQSGGGNQNRPPPAILEPIGPVVLNQGHPTSYVDTRHPRRFYLIALLAILITGGTIFVWKYDAVGSIKGSQAKLPQSAIGTPEFHFPDSNSSDAFSFNDTSATVVGIDGTTTIRNSQCSAGYYSSTGRVCRLCTL